MKDRIRLFVDMDGTLAEFKSISSSEELYEKGYFKNLKPFHEVVQGVRNIIDSHKDIEVYIISCVVNSVYAIKEKNEWLDTFLPAISSENRLFIPDAANKGTFISNLKKTDYLLDDYNKNLIDWEKNGGSSIKLINGINDKRGSWIGERIDYCLDNHIFSYTLVNKMVRPIIKPLSIKENTALAMEAFVTKKKAIAKKTPGYKR